jgi:hypothetical protein
MKNDGEDVRCPWCHELVAVRDAPAHLEECRRREHPTAERFEP